MRGATLITGVSSGIGLETAIYLARKGHRVVGTLRDPGRRSDLDTAAREAEVAIDVVRMDVNVPETIDEAVDEIVGRYGAIDGLVNNAGIQIRGYFEDLSAAEIRRVFETNVFGTMNVTRRVLPGMRAARRGRMVFLSSIAGLTGSLGLSAYCSSKFALEGFAESLALEMELYGVHVSLVEPGIINTPIWNQNMLVAEGAQDPQSPNRNFFAASERMASWAVKTSGIGVIEVARAIDHALSSRRPRRRYLIGKRPAVFVMARRFLPQTLFDYVYFRTMVENVRKGRRDF